MHSGKQFSSTYQPKVRNGGRKPSKLRKFIKENNVYIEDVRLMIKEVLFTYSEDKLREMLIDTSQPMIIRLFIRAYLDDIKKGTLQNVIVLLDRAYGKPDQNISHSGSLGVDVTQMNKEEREEKLNQLINKYNKSKESIEENNTEKNNTEEETEVDKKTDNE